MAFLPPPATAVIGASTALLGGPVVKNEIAHKRAETFIPEREPIVPGLFLDDVDRGRLSRCAEPVAASGSAYFH